MDATAYSANHRPAETLDPHGFRMAAATSRRTTASHHLKWVAAPEHEHSRDHQQQGHHQPLALGDGADDGGQGQEHVAEDHHGIHGAGALVEVAPDAAPAALGDFSEGRVHRSGGRVLHLWSFSHGLSLDGNPS